MVLREVASRVMVGSSSIGASRTLIACWVTGEATLSATDFWTGFWTLFWGPIQGWIFHRSAYKPASFQQHIETQAGFVTIEVHLPNLR